MDSSGKIICANLYKVMPCLMACLCAVIAGTGNFVLCLGENGHIAIEFAHNDPCHSSRGHAEESSMEPHRGISDEHCCSCFDIPITVEDIDELHFGSNFSKTADLLDYGLAHSMPAPAGSKLGRPTGLLHRYLLPFSSLHGSLSTTVLLI